MRCTLWLCLGLLAACQTVPEQPTTTAGCNVGMTRCDAAAGKGYQAVCVQNNKWILQACAPGATCIPGRDICLQSACNAGKLHCNQGAPSASYSTCAADGSGWLAATCASGSVCAPLGGEDACRNVICKPGAVRCKSNRTGLETCDAYGVGWTTTSACSALETCVGAACIPASTALGEVFELSPAQAKKPYALTAGRYALAVISLDASDTDAIAFPVQISGSVPPPPQPVVPPPPPAPVPAPKALRCGSGQFPPLQPRPGAQPSMPLLLPFAKAPVVGEQRVFHFPLLGTQTTQDRTGVLRTVGKSANFWEDISDGPPNSVIGGDALADLAQRLDTGVIPRDAAIFGAATDVDGNGKIDVFYTNLLPYNGAEAFVAPETLFPPGTFLSAHDHGEVVYAAGTVNQSDVDVGFLAAVVAHELQHLTYRGQRFSPYLNNMNSIPASLLSDNTYAIEGMAHLAASWSGQITSNLAFPALNNPDEMSLARLFGQGYDSNANQEAAYGYGLLIIGYLFDQAGAVDISDAAKVKDLGGIGFVQQFMAGNAGPGRLQAMDGRKFDQVYIDLGATLLVSTLKANQLSAATAQDPKYHFKSVSHDISFGGDDGVGLGAGTTLLRTDWAYHGTLRRGGMAFLDLGIGDAGATIEAPNGQVALVLVRYPGA